MTIGEEIKKRRLELGWSREAVAMSADVSEMHLYRLEIIYQSQDLIHLKE